MLFDDGFPASAQFWLILTTLLAVVAAAFWWLSGDKKRKKSPVDLKSQTRILPDGSRIYAGIEEPVAYNYEDAQTAYDAVLRGLRVSKNGPMLGYRKKQDDGTAPYVWMTYQEVLDAADNLAYGFSHIGLNFTKDAFVGVSSKNRPEWVVTELAIYRYHSVLVPLYDTYGEEARIFVLNQTEIEIVVCENEEKANELISNKRRCPSLKYLVVFDPFSANLKALAREHGIQVYAYDELMNAGRSLPTKPKLFVPKADDLCTVCYTSGTTGRPKGAMLTHCNVVAAGTGCQFFQGERATPDDVYISYLPLAHTYERVLHCVIFQHGARLGFYSGDIRKLMEDAALLKPTMVALVPRIVNRIYDKVITECKKSAIAWALFSMSLAYKKRLLARGIMRNDTIFDRLFKRVRELLGGRTWLLMIGSAPLAGEVVTFTRAVFGCTSLQGYGQTECGGVGTTTLETDYSTGHAGVPICCCVIKLVDVPELNYYVKDGYGEICIHGYNVFKGYYKDEKLTKEALDEEGWLHTADIGEWTENGCLKIVDRKKSIFKLQQGEYIAPEKIESAYAKSELIMQSFIYGETLKACVVGIIVPDEAALLKLASEKLNLNGLQYEKLCALPAVKKLIFDVLIDTGKNAGLQSFEQVRDICVTTQVFSVENNLLTPTMKNRRPQLEQHFKQELTEMYAKLK